MSSTLKIEGLCRLNVYQKRETKPLYFMVSDPDPFNNRVFEYGTYKLFDNTDSLVGTGAVNRSFRNQYYANIDTTPLLVVVGSYDIEIEMHFLGDIVVLEKTVLKVI